MWEVGKVYMTRGRFGLRSKVSIVARNLNENDRRIGGIITSPEGKRGLEAWYADGRYNRETESSLDLTTDLAP